MSPLPKTKTVYFVIMRWKNATHEEPVSTLREARSFKRRWLAKGALRNGHYRRVTIFKETTRTKRTQVR